MNTDKYFKRFLIVITVIIAALFSYNKSFSYEFIDWHNWDIGYEVALRDAEDYESPLIIYFHQANDALSQKMTEEYLSQGEVEDFLDDIPKSELDPEDKKSEAGLKSLYDDMEKLGLK